MVSGMNRGFVCFLVLGLAKTSLGADVAYDNVGSETKEISSKITGGTSSINYGILDKNKRGAVKITNTDAPNFNQLSSTSTSSVNSGFKPVSGPVNNPPPFKYLYSNQYYQPNPYLTYVQIPHAAQIAAQYAFQSNPVAHYFQTPTQIQYVSAPTVAQIPQIKYQSFGNEYTTPAAAGGQTVSTDAVTGSTQYITPSQQAVSSASQSYVSSGSSSATQASASTAQSTSQNKQVQTPLYQSYQTAQQFYYPQQPFYTFVMQPQISPASFVYQQPNANYLLKQQQQFLNLYGGNRFVYTPTANAQVPYIVPVAVTPNVQESTTTASNVKTSDKTLSTTQHSASSSSYPYGTKA